jgi:hypothetical protein
LQCISKTYRLNGFGAITLIACPFCILRLQYGLF